MVYRYEVIKASNRNEAMSKFRSVLRKNNEVLGRRNTCHKVTEFGKKRAGYYACNTYAHKRKGK